MFVHSGFCASALLKWVCWQIAHLITRNTGMSYDRSHWLACVWFYLELFDMGLFLGKKISDLLTSATCPSFVGVFYVMLSLMLPLSNHSIYAPCWQRFSPRSVGMPACIGFVDFISMSGTTFRSRAADILRNVRRWCPIWQRFWLGLLKFDYEWWR